MGRRALARTAVHVAVAAAVVLLAACVTWSGARAGGDPGNKQLHLLAADPLFATLPPGATRNSFEKSPAHYRKTPFEGEGWDGPSVVLRFTSSAPILDVYRDFNQLAEETSWAPGGKGSLGVTFKWSKTYPSAHAVVTLLLDNSQDETLPRGYSLQGSIVPRTASLSPTTRTSS